MGSMMVCVFANYKTSMNKVIVLKEKKEREN